MLRFWVRKTPKVWSASIRQRPQTSGSFFFAQFRGGKFFGLSSLQIGKEVVQIDAFGKAAQAVIAPNLGEGIVVCYFQYACFFLEHSAELGVLTQLSKFLVIVDGDEIRVCG